MSSWQLQAKAELERRARSNALDPLWTPQPGPQSEAYFSPADEVFYGGAAGGGKTDLGLGLAITQHRRSVIFRREYTQLTGAEGIIERSRELLENVARFNGIERLWRGIPGGRKLEFGALQYENDKKKWQGRPHDLICFDELPEFLESQYLFVIGWLRTTIPGQRVRILNTGNPPTSAEGEWVIERWGAWLDETHDNPAVPGALRWYARIGDEDTEMENGDPVDFNGETIYPMSRTFIPASLQDNAYLRDTNYLSNLQALPEPLRSQLIYGDFGIGLEDDPWQVIPTQWVRLANARWEHTPQPDAPLSRLGVDVARGGSDQTVLARAYAQWFAPLEKHPGHTTPDGPSVAALVTNAIGATSAPINLDVIGVGTSPYDILRETFTVNPINFAEGTEETDKSGRLQMRNVRAAAWWGLREALDPTSGSNLCLPPDRELMADLTAPRWKISISGVLVESKDDIKKRLGRSPDCGDAVALANYNGMTFEDAGELINADESRFAY